MATAKDLAKEFSKRAGYVDQYDVREVESVDGTKQTQLIDKTTGSVSFVFSGDLPDGVDGVVGTVGTEAAVTPKEAAKDNKEFRTSNGVLATPTQPEAVQAPGEVTEVDNTDKSAVASDQTAETTKSQRSTTTQREQ